MSVATVSAVTDPGRGTGLRLGPLSTADRAAWEPLARGYKTFYETEVSDAGYQAAWQRRRTGDTMPGLGAWHASSARARRLYDRVAVHQGFLRYNHPVTSLPG